ncbi:MAG: response regulator transcription factor [Clostridia bacterium]|nr:response regulator transcription factor [Clostridia bacterium]
MKKILVCEDEESIRSFVVLNLRRAGYTVIEAGSGEEALARFKEDPAIPMALLDVMLPGISGFDTCRRLRQQSRTMGIIMLTALAREEEKVGGLQCGADDYVTKPFSTAELVARVEALYRRVNTQADVTDGGELRCGDFVLDMRADRLYRRGEWVELTQIQTRILTCLMNRSGSLVTRAEILDAVWHDEDYADDKIVDVNIRRLRVKVEIDPSVPRHLQTVWGRGYQWNV